MKPSENLPLMVLFAILAIALGMFCDYQWKKLIVKQAIKEVATQKK